MRKRDEVNKEIRERIGRWLRQARKERHLDLGVLAERAEMHMSSVDRFENARVDPRLISVLRLCDGLEVPLEVFLNDIFGYVMSPLPSRGVPMVRTGEVLTVEDTLTFVHGLRHSLSVVWTEIKRLECFTGAAENDENTLARPESVEQFLEMWISPYPESIRADLINGIYRRGGLLTMTDIGRYITEARRIKKTSKLKLERRMTVSDASLLRWEKGVVDTIKLIDVLNLEKNLGQETEILNMYIQAMELYRMIQPKVRTAIENPRRDYWSLEEFEAVRRFIYLCRRLQVINEKVFVTEVRQSLRTIGVESGGSVDLLQA